MARRINARNKQMTDEQREIEIEGLRERLLLLTEILSQASLYFRAQSEETKRLVLEHLKRDLIDVRILNAETTDGQRVQVDPVPSFGHDKYDQGPH